MPKIAERIIGKAIREGHDEAVASIVSYRTSYLKIANSKVDSIVTKSEREGSLFVSSKKRVFGTNIDEISPAGVGRALLNAKKSVKGLVPKEDYYGIAEGPFTYRSASAEDKQIANYDNELLSDIANSSINAALAAGAKNVAGMLIMSNASIETATSKHASATDSSAYARLSLRVFAKEFSAQRIAVARRLKDLNPETFAKRTAELAEMVSRSGRMESGVYDAVYLQQPAGALLSSVNSMACVGSVESGGFLTGKLGKQIANKDVRIYDDGASPNLAEASRFDAEGHPSQKTPLVGDGKLLTYLHNHSTARKYGTESTGNAGLVLPDPNVFVMEHKSTAKSLDSLIGKVDRGVLVTNTWYTRFSNLLTGDFSTVPRDITIYIENGEPKFAVKQVDVSSATGIRISDNMIRMLKNINYAANDPMQTADWETDGHFLTPSIMASGAKVTTA